MVSNDKSWLDRRTLLAGAGALCAAPALARGRRLAIIEAPSNLGLRPLRLGHEPGAWAAPKALRDAELHKKLAPAAVMSLPRPQYRFEPEPGTRIRNGHEIRRFSEALANMVSRTLRSGSFPLVLGGDCSILLGCLLGARASGQIGLVHVDGHSDFFHPGNYDADVRPGSAAGMDLALATGRGETLLASWDGEPLVEDAHVVQIGERDETDPDYAYRDIEQTLIRRLPVREVLRLGISASVARALAPVGSERRKLWLHVDLDVLNASLMPAVDSPGSPGLGFRELAMLIDAFARSGRVLGMDVTIFDPELDPDGQYAGAIAQCLVDGLSALRIDEEPR